MKKKIPQSLLKPRNMDVLHGIMRKGGAHEETEKQERRDAVKQIHLDLENLDQEMDDE